MTHHNTGRTPWNAGKGDGWTDKRGYQWVYITRDGRRRAIRKHRHIMEQHLGRPLEPWELVHHKNGDKADNRVENLEVTEFGQHTTHHHTGTRRDEDARRSMEAFAILREELKRTRESKAELLEACKAFVAFYDRHGGKDNVATPQAEYAFAQTAIAKAEGKVQA